MDILPCTVYPRNPQSGIRWWPSGAHHLFAAYPGLTAWANFFRRFAAGVPAGLGGFALLELTIRE